jgi:hypothetical protein
MTDSPNMQSLPDGIEALRALVLATMSERDATLAVWKPSSRRSPKKARRRRSETPSYAKTTPPSGVPAEAHCRRTCHGSR